MKQKNNKKRTAWGQAETAQKRKQNPAEIETWSRRHRLLTESIIATEHSSATTRNGCDHRLACEYIECFLSKRNIQMHIQWPACPVPKILCLGSTRRYHIQITPVNWGTI